jgi:glycogen debranching enzyme
LKNKTGTSFDLYSDFIIRNGNWDPWIDSIKESLQVDKNPQILEELSELLKIFEEAKYKGYGLVFYGD